MNWFFIALLGPLLWSISNHIDKFLLGKHFKGVGKEALILYSTLFGLVVLPIAYFFDSNVLSIKFTGALVLIFAGCLNALTIYLYLYALENDEASIVVPFFQMIPVFAFILGFFILGEVLSVSQMVGSLVVILGAGVLSLEIGELQKIKFRKKIVLIMFGSSLSFAIYETLFKAIAVDSGFWVSTFWQYVGLFVFGSVLFLSKQKYRNDFLYLIKKHNWKFFFINVINESLTIVGNSFYNFALLLAPIALIMTTNGYQPILVFVEGIILTLFFPKISKENVSLKHLAHKILAILIVFMGTFVMYN